MPKPEKVLNTVVNLGLLAFLGYASLGPNGFLTGILEERRARQESQAAIRQNWVEMTGSASADTTMVIEFTDYECPFCRRMHSALEGAAGSAFQVIYLHIPIDQLHPMATAAAKSAICAEGQDRFQEMHEYLITTEEWVTPDVDWAQVAAWVGVPDTESFLRCRDSSETEERLARDARIAQELGVMSTPTFVAREGLHVGIASIAELHELMGRSPG